MVPSGHCSTQDTASVWEGDTGCGERCGVGDPASESCLELRVVGREGWEILIEASGKEWLGLRSWEGRRESVSPAPSTASELITWDEWMWNCGPGCALSGWATLMWCLMCSKYNQELRMQLFSN